MALRFHPCHGSAIALSASQTCATRGPDTYHHGLCFSDRPLCVNERVGLQLRVTTDWAGALRVGVTSVDPATLTSQGGVPSEAHPHLVKREGFWVRVIPERLLASSGCHLVLNLTSLGQLQLFVNGHHKGALLLGLPVRHRLWLLLDIYGNTDSATFVTTDAQLKATTNAHTRINIAAGSLSLKLEHLHT
ncbi:protein neuralized [Elysia marginata]|uniref:Protein neuralized n=1 Tax=Elysia marginata TaxID=1093978 RepID=A0AAV4H5F8_9GAST|nr:protein neuralized [Elysia marginata]